MRPSLAFRTWDRSSSVRSRQHCYTLSEDDLQDIDPERWFPPYIAPLLNHPKIKALPTHQRLTIHQAHLIYFLDYTTDLEIEHVNNAVHAMTYGALSRYFLPETHQAALKLYVDEGYHALFSRETADQISAHLGIERKKSSRLSSLLEYVNSTHEEYRHMAKFVIGFISETLITEELLSLSKESLVPGVYNLLRDHLHDESKHSIYFSNCFQQLIPKISEKEKFFLTQSLIDVLLIFCRPDREFIKSLFENNLELADALISELEQQVIIRLKEISKKTLNIVSKTELFNNHRFGTIFDYNGVLP